MVSSKRIAVDGAFVAYPTPRRVITNLLGACLIIACVVWPVGFWVLDGAGGFAGIASSRIGCEPPTPKARSPDHCVLKFSVPVVSLFVSLGIPHTLRVWWLFPLCWVRVCGGGSRVVPVFRCMKPLFHKGVGLLVPKIGNRLLGNGLLG